MKKEDRTIFALCFITCTDKLQIIFLIHQGEIGIRIPVRTGSWGILGTGFRIIPSPKKMFFSAQQSIIMQAVFWPFTETVAAHGLYRGEKV